jgi:hypothetical protein
MASSKGCDAGPEDDKNKDTNQRPLE